MPLNKSQKSSESYSMKIWLLQTGEPIPAIDSAVRKMRTAILFDEITKRGHSVLWWASAFEHQRKVMISDSDRNVNTSSRSAVRLIKGTGYKHNISLFRYLDHYVVASKFRMQSKRFPSPDVIVASTPCYLLAHEASCYAKKRGIPFIVDIRDLWPDFILDQFKRIGYYSFGKLLLHGDMMKVRILLSRADAIFAVSEGYLDWGLKKSGRSRNQFDQVFYLGYQKHANSKTIPVDETIPKWLKRIVNLKLIIFIGTFGFSYELELIVEIASRFWESDNQDICFVLAGAGEQFSKIQTKAMNLPNVVFPGWITSSEIGLLLKYSYAGLVPCNSMQNTIPNKPFEYLSEGLPLINSLEGEMAQLIEKHQIGLNYLPGNGESLYRHVDRIAGDDSLYNMMSHNALKFFNEFGDAGVIYQNYIRAIEELKIKTN